MTPPDQFNSTCVSFSFPRSFPLLTLNMASKKIFSRFWYTFRDFARFELWLWMSGPPTCSPSTWLRTPTSTKTQSTANTDAIASFAPNFTDKAAAELGHTGDIYSSFTQNTESLGEGTMSEIPGMKGFPRDSTNLKVRQAA